MHHECQRTRVLLFVLGCALGFSPAASVLTASAGEATNFMGWLNASATAQDKIEKARVEIGGRVILQDEEGGEKEAKDEQDENKIIPDGPITEAAESVAKLVSFEWKSGILTPKVIDDRQEIQTTVYAIRNFSGGGGMSSSSSGNDSWWYQFQGNRMVGTFQNNWPRNNDDGLKFRLVELESPYRELTIQSQSSDQLSILLTGGTSPFILRVKQDANGEFMVQEVDGVDVHTYREKNFGTFCRKNVDYAQTRLLPLLRAVGISPPATPQDLSVQEAVVKRLRPLDAERVEQFKELVKTFDSPSFDEREQATKQFASQFEDYRDVATRAIDDESYSAETRTRLLALLKENSENEETMTRDVISRLDLTNDAKYLVWLLEQREGQEDRDFIVAQLESLTDESFGHDIASWIQWAGNDSEAEFEVKTQAVDPTMLTGDGQLMSMREQTAKLLKLTQVDNGLKLDRDHWAKPFGGKSLSTLNEEIEAEIKKRGLPTSFFNGIDEKRYPMLGYPHVLFESFYQELRSSPRQGAFSSHISGSHHTPNRQFSMNGLDCSIATQVGDARGVVRVDKEEEQPQIFRLRLSESDDLRRTISVEEDEEGCLRVEFTCESADVIVRLIQLPKEEGWVVQDVRGTEVFADQAKTYEALHEANQAYFDDTFFPLLERFGVIAPGQDALPESAEGSETSTDENAQTDAKNGISLPRVQRLAAPAEIRIKK